MAVVRQWFGARRLLLKARYAGRRAWTRLRDALTPEPPTVALEDVHRRLELTLAAAYGREIAIVLKEERGWMRRRLRRHLPFLFVEAPPTVDGETIKLPTHLATHGDLRLATDRYRLLAMEQAERIARGTLAHAAIRDPLERDLYMLREGAAIDATLAQSYPGMHRAMEAERASALARRPQTRTLTATERDVEQRLVTTLMTPLDALEMPSTDPAASLAWAKETARNVRRGGDRYRGVPLAPAWGALPRASTEQLPGYNPPQTLLRGSQQSSATSRPQGDKQAPNPQTPSETSHGNTANPDTDGKTGRAGNPADAGRNRDTGEDSTDDLPRAIPYDEWDGDRGMYIRAGASVRLYDPPTSDPSSLRSALHAHAATARQIRQHFERLRARRTLTLRQPRGDTLDLSACVDAMIARRMGGAPDDRLYVDTRPARRGIAIALLVDASGSTATRVTDEWRIIDLEQIACLLATRALDALGDRYAIYSFSGRQASNVKVTVVKDFSEPNGDTITGRIAAIKPDGFTRLGAVVRHATRELARQTAGHRLLLLLSDGRPNDVDAYQGPYGVEDSRQAILEARASGVFPYCITIDGAASEYLPRIFGNSGHTVLQKPEQLPNALLSVVRGLIKQ